MKCAHIFIKCFKWHSLSVDLEILPRDLSKCQNCWKCQICILFLSLLPSQVANLSPQSRRMKIFASKAFETQNSSQIWSKRLASTRPRQTVITRGFGKYKLVPGFGFGKTDIWIKDFDVFVSFYVFMFMFSPLQMVSFQCWLKIQSVHKNKWL